MPTVQINASAGDGHLPHWHGTWATLRAATAATSAVGTESNGLALYIDGGNNFADPQYYLYRGYLPFSLAAIPSGATIIAATVYVYVTAKASTAGGDVWLVTSTQASLTALATSDYDDLTTTAASDTKPAFSALTTSAYNSFPLNAAGIAQLQAGSGKFGLRPSQDINNSPPSRGTGTYNGSSFHANFSENGSNKPYIEITYANDRSGADALAWTDSLADAPVQKAGGGLLYNRTTTDTLAFSDAAPRSYLVNLEDEIELFPAGPLRTTLNGSVNFASLGTITLASMPAGVPTAGQITILSAAGQRAWTVTYTGKSGNTLTGCTSWKTSGTAASGTTVSWHDAEQNFPSIVNLPPATAYPYGRLFATCTRHCGDDVEGTSDGEMVARYSDDGGETWSTATVIASAVNSAYGIWGTCTAAFADGTLWIGWYEHNVDYLNVVSYSKYSTDGGATWSTPVEIDPDVVETGGTFIATGASPLVDELDDLYLPVYVYPAGADQSDLPYIGYSAIIKSTDYGATWTLRGKIELADTGGRGTTEPAIADLGDGTWIVMLRQEVGSTPGDTLDRFRIYTDDKGATFRDGASVISNLSNWCNVIRTPDGVLVTQGGREAYPYGPASYYSYDGGATWPSYVMEDTYGDKIYYAGADQESVTLPDGQVRIAFVRACQGTSFVPLSTASTYFRWFQLPPYALDTLAWTDTAAKTTVAPRTGADTVTFTDATARIITIPGAGADTLTLTDTATAQRVALRDAADALAWTDTGARTSSTASKTGADTVTFTDAGGGSVFATSAITVHPQGMVPGTAIAAYLRWEWRGPVAAKLNAGPGAAVAETTVSDALTATFALAPGEYVAYSPAYPTKRLFFMVTE